MHALRLLYPLMLLACHHRRLRPPPPPLLLRGLAPVKKLQLGTVGRAMLGSLHHHSSSSSDTDNNNDNKNGGSNNSGLLAAATAVPSARDLVLACADLLQRGDLPAARRAAGGDHFARALALRADAKAAAAGRVDPGLLSAASSAAARPASSGAYLAFNQIAPFLRFAHLTANQAILDAVEGARRIHILDLDAAHGVQWPPLLQAIAERADPAAGPPEVRITGAGADRDTLLRTGSRLRAFARSIQLPFHFTPLLLSCAATHQQVASGSTTTASSAATSLELHPDETLAVNCVMFLHKLGGQDELAAFLKWVKAMAPAVMTIAERETVGGGYDRIDDLPQRAAVAMDHYSAVFEALEATVPPGSRERLAVEQEVLGREIEASLGPAGGRWWRGLERWGAAARAAGFAARPLSAFAVSQARLLLRLHYPSEGYLVQEARGACFLGWQTRPLLSVSSWQ
ncbi:Protein MONOCULM 1 [Dichanthelium oligosanthes]|uniref:Protein MONOCULM 1 n=1 Tax=Dichanthelium oligosanthes TaxID=888268 RepID=A0A1E5VB64_9POAL|nr:Protein MONOCULM 1 [Dichanthelium oligosanthes]